MGGDGWRKWLRLVGGVLLLFRILECDRRTQGNRQRPFDLLLLGLWSLASSLVGRLQNERWAKSWRRRLGLGSLLWALWLLALYRLLEGEQACSASTLYGNGRN